MDTLLGLILLGLGINKGPFAPSVQGAETMAVAGQTATMPPPTATKPPITAKDRFRLKPEDFTVPFSPGTATKPGVRKTDFDRRAFGMGILKMQENFLDQMEASREAAKQEFESRKQEFKAQLQKVKDERKRNVVDKLNTQCQNVNQKRTEKMSEMLTRLSTVLTNVTNRAATAKANGKDTSSVDAAVTAAQAAIADAQAAVSAQAGKTCTITITGETSLKTDVGKTISTMQQDLRTVYEKVIAARKAVMDAVKALALVLGESLTATPTPTPTP